MSAKTQDEYFPKLVAERLDVALCRASTSVARAAEAHAADRGLGLGQELVLKMLDDVGPCSQQSLSDGLRIDRSVMVGVCDDLEDHGYVRRERNPEDRRSYAVTITAAGRRRLRKAEESTPAFLDHAFDQLTEAERSRLSALLAKLLGTAS